MKNLELTEMEEFVLYAALAQTNLKDVQEMLEGAPNNAELPVPTEAETTIIIDGLLDKVFNLGGG